MKRYEGLFIFKNPAKEDALKEIIDKISEEITAAGGKIETVQKMGKRSFSRVADKKFTSGQDVNFIFQSEPSAIAPLRKHLALNEDVFRVLFTVAPPPKEAAPPK